jgi:hypothetical protein
LGGCGIAGAGMCFRKEKNENESWQTHWPAISYVSSFLIGVILFWSFGKNWLNLDQRRSFSRG